MKTSQAGHIGRAAPLATHRWSIEAVRRVLEQLRSSGRTVVTTADIIARVTGLLFMVDRDTPVARSPNAAAGRSLARSADALGIAKMGSCRTLDANRRPTTTAVWRIGMSDRATPGGAFDGWTVREGEQVSWHALLAPLVARDGEDIDSLVSSVPEEVLRRPFVRAYGTPQGEPFTAWGRAWVYFPLVYDGYETVGHAPRFPCDVRMPHQGDGNTP